MLVKFCVENFKAFQRRLEFDLGNIGNYEFNTDAVAQKAGAVSKAAVYGFNGCGKSSLGLAIFDIVTSLTDREKGLKDYDPYRNLNNPADQPACFEYFFRFDGSTVSYYYKKTKVDTLIYEKLLINGKTVLEYDFIKNQGSVCLAGTETLNLNANDSGISRVKYVRSNALLTNTPENNAFKAFIRFVDNMLMFYSLDETRYRGYKNGQERIPTAIIEAGKLKDFEAFLRENNVPLTLAEGQFDGQKEILVRYNKTFANFYSVASTGTKSLALFYYWYIKLDKASFIYMDEFDAFYHFELAENIVRLMKTLKDIQVIFTTHNTDLLSNDILRPDCYYWLNQCEIKSLNRLTEKELRKAHNLQKMFKAGAFT